jgi:hypothetical protein
MKIFIIMACLAILFGCSVQSSQLSAVMGLIKKPPSDISLNGWSVKYADYEAIVYPVNASQGTLFSNQTGDIVFFDGWSVRRVSGLGLRGPAYENSDISNQRTFVRGSRTLTVHQCNQWQQKQQSGKKQFSQSCQGDIIYSNSILVEQDGSISVIQQIIDDRYEPLILTRLN